ncbi:MAG TPA: sugar phosphate isomerase/epimerase [Bryobacteraceae bacterium]|nr:sugar phosphate isomerase/epimerase [Bryobacteraceae bacterium]
MITAAVLHSVSYAGFWGQESLPLEAVIDKAAELGFDGLEIMAKRPHFSVLDYGPAERARLRAQLDQRRLRCACLAGYTNFTADLEHADIPHREFQIRHVEELAAAARDLGCDLVRVFTGYDTPAAPHGRQWSLVVESLRECARRAAPFGVTVGVQNHHDVACGFESMRDLIRAVNEPNCRAMFDAWAPALHGDDLRRAARTMAAVSVYTTIADYQLRPRYRYDAAAVNFERATAATLAVPLGEGFIDYDAFLTELCASGFDGPVAYEMCSPLRDGGGSDVLDRYARTFLEFMERFRGTRTEAVTSRSSGRP